MVENVFFYTDFFFIDHFDCMIKMFCLKDQKNPRAPVSAAAAAAALVYYCGFFFDVVICVFSFFFPRSVMGEYDLRKGEKKRRNPLLKEIMVSTLRILLFSLSFAYIEINTENRQKQRKNRISRLKIGR